MTNWRLANFAEVIQSRGSGTTGLPQSEWASQGKYPVIGQGAEYVEGWTDRDDLLIRPNPALVLYGGHTRRTKFVNRPFVPGPNVKILEPAPELDAAFLFRYLEQLDIKSRGYADHFPEVRRHRIPVPSLPEQQRIADILDKADALRTNRRAAIDQLDALTQSVFLDMFGDPSTNPKGWPKASLEELFVIARGGSPRPIDDYITDDPDGINWIMIGDTVEGGKYITSTKKRIRPDGAHRSRTVKPGDFLLTNSMSFGRPYILRTFGCIHDGWLVLSPRREDVEPNYFYALLGSRAVYAEFARRAPGATVKNLNIDLVRGVTVPVPPLPAQEKFAETVATIEGWESTFGRSLTGLDSLFTSLQHRAFRGEL